jgi:hypothetical protein
MGVAEQFCGVAFKCHGALGIAAECDESKRIAKKMTDRSSHLPSKQMRIFLGLTAENGTLTVT